MAQARARDRCPTQGPLHGVPVGIKDLIDTSDMPTSYGSPIYAGHQPAWDAASVALLRRHRRRDLGKTVTTEFAMFTPGKTANPHNVAHTPGGSSSGSAAAVADMMVPLALGTQTAGSIIRPASFCGVVGYKPTHGQFPVAGIKALSQTLDTLGGFARSVADFALLRAVLVGGPAQLSELERRRALGSVAPHSGRLPALIPVRPWKSLADNWVQRVPRCANWPLPLHSTTLLQPRRPFRSLKERGVARTN